MKHGGHVEQVSCLLLHGQTPVKATSVTCSLVISLQTFPFLNPPPRNNCWPIASFSAAVLLHRSQRKLERFALLHGLAMYLSHCLGRVWLGPDILISSAEKEPRLLRSPTLIELELSYLSNTKSTLLHLLSSSGADTML